MAIKDRLQPAAAVSAQSGFTCPRYDPLPGEKRCRHFISNGSCARPDELMCVEWLKANGQQVPAAQDSPPAKDMVPDERPRDLFGNPLPEAPEPPPSPPKPAVEASSLKPEPATEPPLVRTVSDEEIRSLKSLGVEICIASEAIGDVWLVPEYTGADRQEITIEHAATITAICAAFPGAKVVQYEKAKPKPAAELET